MCKNVILDRRQVTYFRIGYFHHTYVVPDLVPKQVCAPS